MPATQMQALPQSCYQNSMVMILLRGELFPKLAAMMSDEEIIAAHNEKQPALDKMREITCRGCAIRVCPLNFKYSR